MYHFTKEEFKSVIRIAGIKEGDILFGHSNIGFFGRIKGGDNADKNCKLILEAIFEVIGDQGTLILPTYTYSFSNNQIYDPNTSKGIGGYFSEYVRKKSESIRSLDPSVSVTAIGNKSKEITRDLPLESYGNDGIFDRLLKFDVKTLNLNIDSATTFVHYAEKLCGVDYRYTKKFEGKIKIKKKLKESQNFLFVRYRHPATQSKFEPFDELAKKMNLVRIQQLGRGFISSMKISDQLEVCRVGIKSNKWFLTSANILKVFPQKKDMIKFEENIDSNY